LNLYSNMKQYILLAALLFSSVCSAETKAMGQYQIGLSMYSLRQLFQSGELHAFDYPQFAVDNFGITQIDVWDGAFPKGWKNDPDFLPELKRRADLAGTEIFLFMSFTLDVSSADDAKLQAAGNRFKSAIDNAVVLGAEYVRIFLKTNDQVEEAEAVRRAVVALRPFADYGEEKGVIVAIEPKQSSRLGSGTFLAKVAAELNHPFCKLMPDFGKMSKSDFYQGTADMMPYTAVVSAKGLNFKKDGSQKNFDYPRLMKIIRDAKFEGIVAIEYEGKNKGPVEGVIAMQKILEEQNIAQ
ncbi:MAG: TIM barrel protein, partial [Verrucomicrobiota bacterium]